LNGSPTVSPTTVAACSSVPFWRVRPRRSSWRCPGAAGVGHEDGLEEAEEGDADEVADEEVGVEERQRERHAEDDDEDVPHALLGVDGADADDLLRVLLGGGLGIELHVLLDVDHGAVGTVTTAWQDAPVNQ